MFLSQLTREKNANGEYPFVVASAGNNGPFDETGSLSQGGGDVFAAVAAATGRGRPHAGDIVLFGHDFVDNRYAIKWVRLQPGAAVKGGDVSTERRSANAYRRGVYSAKSKDAPEEPSDTADGKHTGMSGTSWPRP